MNLDIDGIFFLFYRLEAERVCFLTSMLNLSSSPILSVLRVTLCGANRAGLPRDHVVRQSIPGRQEPVYTSSFPADDLRY